MNQQVVSSALRQVGRAVFAAVFAIWTCTGHAQALRPLPADFLELLSEADAAIAQVSGTLRRIKDEDVSFTSPPRAQVADFIVRMEKSLAQIQAQSGDLRRRESLLALLALNRTLGGVQHDLEAFSAMLQSATVRSPAALDTLNGSLGVLGKSAARLNLVLLKFDSASHALLERLDRAAPSAPK